MTVPAPVKVRIEEWIIAADIYKGRLFRPINKAADRIVGLGGSGAFTPRPASSAGIGSSHWSRASFYFKSQSLKVRSHPVPVAKSLISSSENVSARYPFAI